MTKKLRRMTPILILPQILPTPTPKKSIKLPLFLGKIVEGKIEVEFIKKKMNTPPHTAQPVFYLHSILHGAVSPLPPYNSHSSASTTAPRLSPAIVVLRLCRRSFVDCHFFVVVISTIVASPPPTVHRISSAAVILQTVTPTTQSPCPASCQP